MKSYIKSEDLFILPLIKQVLGQRPTYGYKRVTAMVNSLLSHDNKEKVNKKRIYRIMRKNVLMLQKCFLEDKSYRNR